MKNIKPLLAFIICLWAVVVVTYAKQVTYDQRSPDGKRISKASVMQATSCCCSSSSGGGE